MFGIGIYFSFKLKKVVLPTYTRLIVALGVSIVLLQMISTIPILVALPCTYSSAPSCEVLKSSKLGISFEYPSTWNKLEAAIAPDTINDFRGVIALDILNDTAKRSYVDQEGEGDLHSYSSGLASPILTITYSELPSHTLTLSDYAKSRVDDFRILFMDLNLRILKNDHSRNDIDDNAYWILEYVFSIDDDVDRYGMSLWLIRGESVYEISYLADGYDEYRGSLIEIKNLIRTLYFSE
jgi:hypothetical protein